MKKMYKKICYITLMAVMTVLSLWGCTEKGAVEEQIQQTDKQRMTENVKSSVAEKPEGATVAPTEQIKEKVTEASKEYGFDSKVAIGEGEDGWVYFFLCEYYKEETEPYVYVYNAYNMKHKEVEGFEVEMVDMDGNILGKVKPSIPCIIMNDEYLRDIEGMLAYFEKVKPTAALDAEEALNVSTDLLDKQQVVTLFNEMIESEYVSDGKYDYLPEADTVKEVAENGYCWQVSYLNIHGVIMNVNIEYIYEDGTYLSDKHNDVTLANEEREVADIIPDIEAYIVEKQSFTIDKSYGEIAEETCERLDTILKSIEKGNYR